jgi:hypothetical protein
MNAPVNFKDQPLAFQLGNIGAELQRALVWRQSGHSERSKRSLERALDLLFESAQQAQGLARKRELCRFRSHLAAWYSGQLSDEKDKQNMLNYCLSFAVFARS